MSLLFADSFDHYATADLSQKWTTVTSTGTISANGRNSTSCYRVTGNGRNVTKGFTGAATIIAGFAFRQDNTAGATATSYCWSLSNSGTTHVSFRVEASGAISAYRGAVSGGTLLGASNAGIISDSTYLYIESKVTIDNTAGVVQVKINGTLVLNLSGIDTQNGASTTIDTLLIGLVSSTNYTNTIDYDDLYILNTSGSAPWNDFLGPIRIKACFADGAVASADFTPSAGSNYQNVDESSQDGDTTYNSESTTGDHDTYTFAAVGLTGTVRAVQTNLVVRSDGAGAETIRPKIRISGVDYNGTTVGITTSYADSREIFETSPATAAAWTVTEIDGAEFGIELVS